jgi:hypothetical protein
VWCSDLISPGLAMAFLKYFLCALTISVTVRQTALLGLSYSMVAMVLFLDMQMRLSLRHAVTSEGWG